VKGVQFQKSSTASWMFLLHNLIQKRFLLAEISMDVFASLRLSKVRMTTKKKSE
jgi:hypothetical protein